MTSRVFHFTYQSHVRSPRYSKSGVQLWDRELHHVRDGEPMLELMDVLREASFSWGETLLNLTFQVTRKPKDVSTEKFLSDLPSVTDIPAINEDDLIVATTRCPLSDTPGHDMKAIPQSGTDLERVIFHTLSRSFFEQCSRSAISFRGGLRDLMWGGKRMEPDLDFKTNRGIDMEDGYAYGFVLFAPYLLRPASDSSGADSEVRYRFLHCFGMGGVENWIFSRHLRLHMRKLVLKIVASGKFWCVVGRWKPPRRDTRVAIRPFSLAFADQLGVEIPVVAWSNAPHLGKPWHMHQPG